MSNFSSGYYGDGPTSPHTNANSHALVHLNNTTLQQIDQLVQDVEMEAIDNDNDTTCLVVDTNILLEHLGLLQQFVRDVERARLSILVIIPGAVLNELDGQKKSDRLGWFARRASVWMLEKVKEKRSAVRGQKTQETMKPSRNWRIRQPGEAFGARGNDELILDCCIHFRSRFRTALCTLDKNLAFEAISEGISSVSPRSGRELAGFILGRDLDTFATYQADYTGIESLEQDQDDGMDVDEEEKKLTPGQAMDLLHVQIIDHFTRLLVNLVGSVGGPELEDPCSDENVSQHAPQWKKGSKPYKEWNAGECLEYLDRKRRMKRNSTPRLEVFLSKPYSPGARCGREWTYEAWSSALDGLKQIGIEWNEGSILGDLEELQRHREAVFGVRH